jgi:hypothetical protein
MDYQVDLDPTHAVIRLTVTAEILTPELAEDIHNRLARLASSGGPFAAIVDLSGVTSLGLSADKVRNIAFREPPVPGGRTHVAVAREPSVFGMARMFQLYRDFFGEQYQVVYSLEEAYDIVGAHPEDFTERLLPTEMAA